MLASVSIMEWVLISGAVFILPAFFAWGLWSFTHGIKIADQMLIRTALLIVIVSVPLFILFAVIPNSLKDTTNIIIMVLVLACYWGYCISRLVRRSKKGQILLKAAGVTEERIFILIMSVIILIIVGKQFVEYFILSGSDALKPAPGIFDICFYLLLLAFGVQFTFWSITGVQITENGIICPYQGMIKWDKIRFYAWAGRYDTTLVLRLNKGIWKNIYLRIPLHQKDSAEAILSEKITRTAQFVNMPT